MSGTIKTIPFRSHFLGCYNPAARLLFSVVICLAICPLVMLQVGSAFGQNVSRSGGSDKPATFQPRAGQHISVSEPEIEAIHPEESEEIAPGEAPVPRVVMAPTRSSFLANWKSVGGATGYRMDVSDNASFDSYVNGYHDLDVGQTTSRIVSGLSAGATYYYRVRAYNSLGTGGESETMTAATAITSGLVINPTFDSSITSNPNSAAIQATITQAIAVYQSLFSNPITISILFRYSTTMPSGGSMGTRVALSGFVVYNIPWSTFIASLKAKAVSQNDATANASLPFASLSTYIVPSSAGGRAVGLNTPPGMFANGTVGVGGPYDGIVTLNSAQPLQFTRPVSAGHYDALAAIEHETDEILGLGSHLNATPATNNLRPEDLFSWRAPGTRNVSSSNVRYFSINGGTSDIVNLNQTPGFDFGDWLSTPCPQINPRVQNAFGCTGQSANITASSPEGVALDVIGYNFIPPHGLLGNISTRLGVGTNEDVLIGGFIIGGNGLKQLVLRALGPTLTQFGVNGVLQNPALELHNSAGGLITSNDDWAQASNAQSIPANLRPPNSLESAILAGLDPGSYTAIVRGINNTTGVALLELYDIDPTASSHLANISTRGLVQTGSNVMIAGLIVQSNSEEVIVRALGPTLSQFGVSNALADPTLELRDANGTLIASNNNWKDTQQSDIQASGYAPPNDLESALIRTLTPASYTAIVRGVNNTTGVALVEVYALQ